MGYKLIRAGNTIAQPLQRDYIADEISDLDTIDKEELSPGASVLVLASSQVFMLNTQNEWVEL